MARVLVCFLVLASFWIAAPQESKSRPSGDIEVSEVTARRAEGKILVDVWLRNCGDKPVTGLKIQVDFVAPDKKVMTRRTGPSEITDLDPGDDTSFHAYIHDNPRSVWVRIGATDKKRGELRVLNEGFFPIE